MCFPSEAPPSLLNPAQEAAFARRHRHQRNRVFYLKTPPAVLAKILRADVTLNRTQNRIIWYPSSKSHNKTMHTRNGNAAMPVVIHSDDSLTDTETEHSDVAETSGSSTVPACLLWGMVHDGDADPVYAELVRSAFALRVPRECAEDDPLFLHPDATRDVLKVFVRPDALVGPGAPPPREHTPVVAIVDASAPNDRRETALRLLESAAGQDGSPVAVVLSNVPRDTRSIVGFSIVAERLTRHANVRLVFCGPRPPSWTDIRKGTYTDRGLPVLLPWLNSWRLDLMIGERPVARHVPAPGEDTSGTITGILGGLVDFADSKEAAPPLICFTRDCRRSLLEIAGLPVRCGVWFDPTARVEHLFEHISDRFGDATLWRYTVQGRPIRPQELLLGFRGSVLRATPRVPGGGDREDRDAFAQAAAAARAAPGSHSGSGTGILAVASASSSSAHVAAVHTTPLALGAMQIGNRSTDSRSEIRATPAESFFTAHLIDIEHEEPLHKAQVQEEHLVDIPVPADGLCLYYTAVAALDVAEWRASHDDRGLALTRERQVADREAALAHRDAVVRLLRDRGDERNAKRLEGEGVEAYPEMEDLHVFSEVLGGQISLELPPQVSIVNLVSEFKKS